MLITRLLKYKVWNYANDFVCFFMREKKHIDLFSLWFKICTHFRCPLYFRPFTCIFSFAFYIIRVSFSFWFFFYFFFHAWESSSSLIFTNVISSVQKYKKKQVRPLTQLFLQLTVRRKHISKWKSTHRCCIALTAYHEEKHKNNIIADFLFHRLSLKGNLMTCIRYWFNYSLYSLFQQKRHQVHGLGSCVYK